MFADAAHSAAADELGRILKEKIEQHSDKPEVVKVLKEIGREYVQYEHDPEVARRWKYVFEE